MSDWQSTYSTDDLATTTSGITPTASSASSLLNLDRLYTSNTKYASQNVLPPKDQRSPYYIPFENVDDPRPVSQLIYRFSIWKMIIKQLVFYFKEMCVFKRQTCNGNAGMLENLDVLRKQNSGKLKSKSDKNRIKKSQSTASMKEFDEDGNGNGINANNGGQGVDYLDNELINKLLQTTFLPTGDSSVLSISSTFFNSHNYLKERELITYQHLTNRLIPRLENLRDQLNETIKQMNSIKNSSDFKTKNLKMEIAKTGGILSDYITSIELLRTGHSKSSLGTDLKLKDNLVEPKMDPYILKLKLDLQLKDQLYIEAHMKEMYYDLQYKAVQLEKILYTEIQNCISSYTDLIDNELNSVKDNLILPFKQGFCKNDPTIDWDYFIKNDQKRNFLPINAQATISKQKNIRKNSDIVYPYRNNVISSCIYSGYLDRKSKYLKNYSKFFYVLTINYLHEFKSSDRIKDLSPLQSFPLNYVTVSEVDSDPRKFVIRVNKPNSKMKYTLKSDTPESSAKWVDYLSDLTEFEDTIERNVSYDVSDEESEQQQQQQPIPFIEDSFAAYSNSTIHSASPLTTPDNNSILSHSRSISDDYFKSQHHQVQQSLSQQQQAQGYGHGYTTSQSQIKYSPQDEAFNLSSIAFKSVKSQPNMMLQKNNSSTSVTSQPTSRTHSRSSSRASSRASSPVSRMRNTPATTITRPSALLSPKIAPTTPNSITNPESDYFSYAPRKVQASIIRNGNRLASGATGRLTPGSISSLNIPGGGHTSPPIRSSTTSLSALSTTNLSLPKINVQESTPVATERPQIGFENDDEQTIDSGLERRRKTLSEKLDLTGMINQTSAINMNSNTSSTSTSSTTSALSMHHLKSGKSGHEPSTSAFLKMPTSNDISYSNLPQTPGIIPGSKMNSVFEQSFEDLHHQPERQDRHDRHERNDTYR